MSGGLVSPGRSPRDDGELIRTLHDRIRALELAQTVRVGDWVLVQDPTTGALKAVQPGQSIDDMSDPNPTVEVDLGAARGYIIQDVTNAVWSGVTQQPIDGPGKTLEEMSAALSSIPPRSVSSVNGLGSLVDTFTQTWSQLWGGLARALGVSDGKSIADAANAAANVSTSADTALQLGEWNNAVLGIRNNKTLMSGIDETEEANYSFESLYATGTTDPKVTIPVTATSQPMAFWRATEVAKKGFISWIGKGIAGVTALYIDIYAFNYTTGHLELVHTSPDQIGQATSSWNYLIYNIPSVARIDVVAGVTLAVAFRVVGPGTHSIAGITIATPPHPATVPAKVAAARTDGATTSLSFAALAPLYIDNVPWVGIGILAGDAPPAYFAPRQSEISTTGAWSYLIPDWANYVDRISIGGAGGGAGGNPIVGLSGEGGGAGQWHTETLVRGVDFPASGAVTLTGVIGTGGNGGGVNNAGGTGGDTTRDAIPSGKAAAVAVGGTRGAGTGSPGGDGAGTMTYLDQNYQGGSGGYSVGANNGGPGGDPGGGGGGGAGGTWGIAWVGGRGGRGGMWFVARQS